MRFISHIKRTAVFLKYLFLFRKPEIKAFYCTDIVFKNEGYFLFSWETPRATMILIKETKSSYFNCSGSAFIKLPDELEEVNIAIRNTWYSHHKKVRLCRMELDAQTGFAINTHFESLKVRKIRNPLPAAIKVTVPGYAHRKIRVSGVTGHVKNNAINIHLNREQTI